MSDPGATTDTATGATGLDATGTGPGSGARLGPAGDTGADPGDRLTGVRQRSAGVPPARFEGNTLEPVCARLRAIKPVMRTYAEAAAEWYPVDMPGGVSRPMPGATANQEAVRAPVMAAAERVYGRRTVAVEGLYTADRDRLDALLAGPVARAGAALLQNREAMVAELKARYASATELLRLAQMLPFLVASRAGLPLPLTIELEQIAGAAGLLQSPEIGLPSLLPTAAEPDTFFVYYSSDLDNEESQALSAWDPHAPETLRIWHAQIASGRKRDGTFAGTWSEAPLADPEISRLLDATYGSATMEAFRETLYTRHPIAFALAGNAFDAFALADILRTRDAARRNARLRDAIHRCIDRLEEANRAFRAGFAGKAGGEIDWRAFAPVYEAVAAGLYNDGETPGADPLRAVIAEILRIKKGVDWLSVAELALFAIGICAVCALTGGAAVPGVVFASIGGGSLGLAIGKAARARSEAIVARGEARFADIDPALRAIEASDDPSGAYLGLAIELIGVLPVGKLAKFLSKSDADGFARVAGKLDLPPQKSPALSADGLHRAEIPGAPKGRPMGDDGLPPKPVADPPAAKPPGAKPSGTRPSAEAKSPAPETPPPDSPPPKPQAEKSPAERSPALADDPEMPSPWHRRGPDGRPVLPPLGDEGEALMRANYARLRAADPATLTAGERSFRRIMDMTHRGGQAFDDLPRIERIWLEIEYTRYPKLSADHGTIAEVSKWARSMQAGKTEMSIVANTGEMTGLAMLHGEKRVTSIRLVESGAGGQTPDFEMVLDDGRVLGLEVRTVTRTAAPAKGQARPRFDYDDAVASSRIVQRGVTRGAIRANAAGKIRANQLGAQQGYILVVVEGDVGSMTLLSARQIAGLERRLADTSNILGLRVVANSGTDRLAVVIDNPNVTSQPLRLAGLPDPPPVPQVPGVTKAP